MTTINPDIDVSRLGWRELTDTGHIRYYGHRHRNDLPGYLQSQVEGVVATPVRDLTAGTYVYLAPTAPAAVTVTEAVPCAQPQPRPHRRG